MKRNLFVVSVSLIFFSLIFIQFNCSENSELKTMTKEEQIAHGKYLVDFGGCTDCHTPKVMSPMGPVPDTTRLLSGSPAGDEIPAIEPSMIQPGNWFLTNFHLTTWVGPWGVSFSANLTPDKPTGTGVWTEDIFINAMRTGKHMGLGRPILPPMPWPSLAGLKDEDLKSIFAYLQSIPPINNKVPDPISPDQMSALFIKKK